MPKFGSSMEYRLYGELNCNTFSLIGKKEPDQTKGLGYVFSQSLSAIKALLGLIHWRLTESMCGHIIIDCELPEEDDNNKGYRADIVLRFYDELYNPIKAVCIEAKSKGKKIDNVGASSQVDEYCSKFVSLKPFKENIALVTLTDVTSVVTGKEYIIPISWGDLITAFEKVKEPIVQEYVNYLLKINGNMKQYDKEILSVPAGYTIEKVKSNYLYECPAEGKMYKARMEGHPLYITFRERGNKGQMTTLYKIKDIVKICLTANGVREDMQGYVISRYPDEKDLIERIKNICSPQDEDTPYKEEDKALFILDKKESIELPYPVRYKDRAPQGNHYLTLSQVLRKPNEGKNYVEIKKEEENVTDRYSQNTTAISFGGNDLVSPEKMRRIAEEAGQPLDPDDVYNEERDREKRKQAFEAAKKSGNYYGNGSDAGNSLADLEKTLKKLGLD